MRLHHVQVACPAGGEGDARRFYAEGLGMTEVPKPEPLAARGGAWFRAYDGEAVVAEVHVGVEEPFVPAGHLRFHAFDGAGNRVEVLATVQ